MYKILFTLMLGIASQSLIAQTTIVRNPNIEKYVKEVSSDSLESYIKAMAALRASRTAGARRCGDRRSRGFRSPLLLRQFLHFDLAEGDGAVVALQEEWAGLADFRVEFAAGRAFHGHVVVNLLPVEDHGDFVADHRGFAGLPFAAGLRCKHARDGVLVDRAIAAL